MIHEKSPSASKGLLLNSSNKNQIEKVHIRAHCDYVDLSAKFKHQGRDFTKQFAHIYAVRLIKMRDMLLNQVHRKWGCDIPVRKLIDLKEEENEKCIIIGTLFKHQVLKPSILKEISEENQLAPQPIRTNFVDENDQLILEDEQQRIKLVGNLDVHSVVTGVVCAVLGVDTANGRFVVEDSCFPVVPSRTRELNPSKDPRFIVLLSGMGLANNADSLLPLQLLVDWVNGLLGDPEEQESQARTVRLIIAGNSIRDCPSHKVSTIVNTLKLDVEDTLHATRHLDDFLHQLANFIEVDIMPGEFDPANHMLPQQPMHFCMFPKANAYESFRSVTNPYECDMGGCRIMGTSGQPIHDIAAYSKMTDPLLMLQKTLEWAHLAPTCPDTLAGYPYYDQDPFIINETPHLYFAGNQPEFQTKMFEGSRNQKSRLVCVPSFALTHSCAVVELNTLECYPVYFGTGNFSDPGS